MKVRLNLATKQLVTHRPFLVGAAVGANAVWIVALYSHFSFTPTRATALQSPVV